MFLAKNVTFLLAETEKGSIFATYLAFISKIIFSSSALINNKEKPIGFSLCFYGYVSNYFFIASSTETATATVAPTIGLFPIPRNPIISTCAGTADEPAN